MFTVYTVYICLSYLHGGLHWWKRADTSAKVCLREVVVGGRRGPRVCVASSSSRSLGRTSSLMLVSSRLLGEMERFQSNLLRLASTGNTTRWNRRRQTVSHWLTITWIAVSKLLSSWMHVVFCVYLEQSTLITLHLWVDRSSAFGWNWKCCGSKAVGGLHNYLEKSESIQCYRLQDADWVQNSLHIQGWGTHIWAGGVSGASGSLAPGSTLAAQLLGAMLSDSFQQQVVDSREVIVAAALQRLWKKTEDS